MFIYTPKSRQSRQMSSQGSGFNFLSLASPSSIIITIKNYYTGAISAGKRMVRGIGF